MTIRLLIVSSSLSSESLVSTLLTMPNCPAITVALPQEEMQNSPAILHPSLQSDPHSIVVIDRYEGSTFQSIFKGVDFVFHNGPIVNPEDQIKSTAIINAAEAAGVSHFIFCSVFQSFRTRVPSNAIKLNIEEHLLRSRLNFTTLQPVRAMQEIPLKTTIASKKLIVPFSTSIQHGFVDLRDMALVICNIIFHPDHYDRGRYDLVGQNASYDEIAGFISHATGTNVKCEVVSPADFIANMKTVGRVKSALQEDLLMRTLIDYNSYPSSGNSNVLQWLLGRTPKTWEEYLHRELQ